MGTLARMSDAADEAHMVAVRRRRVILAAAATLGAAASAAWITGLLPGLVVIIAWLPLVAYLPAAFVAERRAARRGAEAALERRSARRVRRASPEVTPERDAAPTHATPTQAGSTRAAPAHDAPAWDDVFDQTA